MSFIRKIDIPVTGYKIIVEDVVRSSIEEQVSVTPYVVIERDGSVVEEGGLMYTYLGPVFSSTKDTYEKYDFDDIRDSSYQNKSVGGGLRLYNITFCLPGFLTKTKNTCIRADMAINLADIR